MVSTVQYHCNNRAPTSLAADSVIDFVVITSLAIVLVVHAAIDCDWMTRQCAVG